MNTDKRPITNRPQVSNLPHDSLREYFAAVVYAVFDFLHGVGAFGNVVLLFDRGRHRPLVLRYGLKNLFDRRFARAPGKVEGTVGYGCAVLQMEAGDLVVE